MKILAVGDFDNGLPKKLKSKLKKEKPDLILSPGDICYGKAIRTIAFKYYESDKDWYDIIGRKKAKKLMSDSVKKGDKILDFLNSLGVPTFLVFGNHDKTGQYSRWTFGRKNLYGKLIRKYKNIQAIDMKCKKYNNFYLIGYGQNNSGPEIPLYDEKPTKKEKRDYTRNFKKIKKLFKGKNPKQIILLTHNVPFKTKLDKITSRKAPKSVRGKHFGSLIAQKIIKKYHPLIAIGGHMHEGQGKTRIGKTLVINSGPASEGKYTVIDIENSKIMVKFHR